MPFETMFSHTNPTQNASPLIMDSVTEHHSNIAFLHDVKKVKHYNDLKGGQGKKLFYRPERFKARNIFKNLQPVLIVNEQEQGLHDLSINGLSFTVKNDDARLLKRGEHVPVQLQYHDDLLFESVGRVVRVETSGLGIKVALNLNDPLHINTLLDRYNTAVLTSNLNVTQQDALKDIPKDYQVLCSELQHLLRRYKSMLDSYEASARQNKSLSDESKRLILERCQQHIIPEWRRIWVAANKHLRKAQEISENGNPEPLKALKKYTEDMLTTEFIANIDWWRCYEKPFGYPGDYILMENLYEINASGEHLFQDLLAMLGHNMASFIIARMEWQRHYMAEFIEHSEHVPTIVNIGCGVAKEVHSMPTETAQKAQFYLLDQDEGALARAYQLAALNDIGSRVHCFNGSYMELIRSDGNLYKALPPIDMAYSLGILDYLTDRRAKNFLSGLYERLQPEGRLVIANMHDVKDAPLWPLEALSDWTLVYRSKETMRSLAAHLDGAKVSIETDSTNHVVFLIVEKGS